MKFLPIAILGILMMVVCALPVGATELHKAPALSTADNFPTPNLLDRGHQYWNDFTHNPAITVDTDDDSTITVDTSNGITLTSDTAGTHNLRFSYGDLPITDGYVNVSSEDGTYYYQKSLDVNGYSYMTVTFDGTVTLSQPDEQDLYASRLAELGNVSVVDAPEQGSYNPDDFGSDVNGVVAVQESADNMTATDENGKINVTSDNGDSLHTLKIPYDSLPVVDGKIVINHVVLNETTGIPYVDMAYAVNVTNDNGFTYIDDCPFSGVTIVPYGTADAYVSQDNGTVAVVNLTNNTIIKIITVGHTAEWITVNNAGTKAYVGCSGSPHGIYTINTSANTVSQMNSTSQYNGVVVTPDGSKLYANNFDTYKVDVFYTNNNTLKTSITLGANLGFGICINNTGSTVYTALLDNKLYKINTTSDTATNSSISANIPRGIAITHSGNKVYINDIQGTGKIYVYWTANNTLKTSITCGSSGYGGGIAISPDDTKVYATDGNAAFYVINANTDTLSLTQSVASTALYGVSFNPNGSKAYFADANGNTVKVVTVSTNTVSATISGFNIPVSFGIMNRQTTPPTANFTSNVTSGSAPLAVGFTDTSTGSPTAWDWDYGDGTSHGTTQNTTHSYSSAGTYTVVLNASNVAGYSVDTQTNYITVTGGGSAPVASFTSNVSTGTAPLTVAFTDTSTNTPTSWAWQWGDGTANDTTQSPTHTFSSAGTYLVNMTATNAYGNSGVQATITVSAGVSAPVAAFTSNISSGKYPVTVAFTDTSTNTPTSWAWNFGDGTANVTTQSPTHVFVGSGTFHVTLGATNAGGTTYIQHDIIVSKATPSLSWSPSPTSFTYGNALAAGQLNAASGGVAGSFAYTLAGNVVVAGNLITVGSDNITATFTPTDTANYTSGGVIYSVFTVSKASPTLTYSPSPSTITYGTTLVSGQLNAGSGGVAGSFGYTFGGNAIIAGNVISAGSDSVTATFTPTDTTNYTSGGTTAATITVNKATPSLSWSPSPTTITYGTGLVSGQLNAGSGGTAGSFAYSFGGNTVVSGNVIQAGSDLLTATFTPTDGTNYTSGGTTTTTITVNKYSPQTSWSAPSPITYPTALSATQLNANANTASYSGGSVAGSFSYNPASGTVLGAGTQTLQTTFTPSGADATNYSANTTSVSLTVNRLAPTITWSNPADIVYPTALSATQLSATFGGISGVATYTPASGTVLGAGLAQNLHVSFTPTDSTNYSTVTADVSINVNKATPSLTYTNPDAITYGTALSATQLSASCPSPAGSITYNRTAGTVLGVGSYGILATFTPTDTANYSTVTATATLVVNQATPVITWGAISPITYGTALSGTQLAATCPQTGSFAYNKTSGTVLGVGTYTILATFTPSGADAVNYTTNTATQTLTVNKATSTISWSNPTNITYGTALSGTQLNAVPTPNSGTLTYTPISGTILGAGASQTLNVSFTPTDSTNYTTATASVIINVSKVTPTITWSDPAAITYGTALSGTQLNPSSGGISGSYTFNPVSGTVLGAGASQLLQCTFTPTDAVNYSTATGSCHITVNKASTSITWGALADITYPTALSATQLCASGSVPGTVTYNVTSGDVLAAGTHMIHATFTPTDTVNYSSSSRDNTLNISKASTSITWADPANIAYGTALSGTQLNAQGSVSGTLTYNPPSGTVLPAGNSQTLHVSLTPDDSTNYSSSSKDVTINVTKLTPTITWTKPDDITYGTALSSTQLNAQSATQGTFVYTPPSGTVLGAGTQSLHTDFTPSDNTNYTSASKDVSINVSKAGTSVSWNNPADIVYGTALSGTQLNAQSVGGIAGSFVYSPVSGTVLSAGTHMIHATFTPSDASNYTASSRDVSIVISKATSSITWVNPDDINYGTPLSSTQLNAQGSVAGSLVYTPPSGTVLPAGSGQTLRVDLTVTDSTNYSNSNKTVAINVNKATSTVSWTQPAAINYGTALSATQLCAAANVPGSFVYNPVSGTVLSAGSHTLNVTFTPTDVTNYTSSTGSTTITVNQGTPTITWSNPANISYGTALSATQLSASSSTAGSFTYSPVSGTILSAGAHTLNVSLTPNDAVNYTTASKSVTINVSKAVPVITWSDPATILYNTPLSSTQLNAQSTASGTFTYDPATGTVLDIGTHVLNVTLVPTDTVNYTNAAKSVNITVTDNSPIANFDENTTSGVVPLTVQFTDNSTNHPTGWTWNFGDGHGTYSQSPVHTYDAVGVYNVSLMVNNSQGNDTMTKTALIHVSTGIVTPIANFSGSPTTGTAPLNVNFTDASDNSPTDWYWTFGDGNNSTEQNPSHIYNAVGNYTVNLTANNSAGNNATSKVDYIVVTKQVLSPIANFTSNATDGSTPFDVQFTDLSTNEPTNWLWNFGDNVTSTDQNPLHRYNVSGNFSVSLAVGNSAGNDSMNKLSYINVTETPAPPLAQFVANRTQMWSPSDAPFTVQFNDTSLHSPATWQWNFGDGQGSTEQNPVHTYTAVGLYNVSLHVTKDAYTSDAVLTGYINISSTPVNLTWTTDRDSYYAPATVHFLNNTANYTGTYFWDFGDGTNSTEADPTHLYQTDSTYNVSLTVVRDGINYTQSHDIVINYVTAGSIQLISQKPDQLADMNISSDNLRLNQTSKQVGMYHAIHSVESGTTGGIGLATIAIIILGAIGLFFYIKYW